MQHDHPEFKSRNTSRSPSLDHPGSDVEASATAADSIIHDIFEADDTVDAVYQEKARILNAAMQEIGMGRYQWHLFFVGGFGWFADNLWECVTGLIINPVTAEFAGFQGPFLLLAQNIGLLVGAVFWGMGCDVWGRRWSFNLTLFITAVFTLGAGGALTPVALCGLIAAWSTGVGGNLPVDSAVFLEFVPASHQWLLTVLSIWWALGQLVGSLVAWPFIAGFSCASSSDCPSSANMGWRYLLWTLGGLMMILFFLRFFVFRMYESPKFLIGRGRDAEAVAVVHAVAAYNGKTSSLTLEMLQAAELLAVSRSNDDLEKKETATDAVCETKEAETRVMFDTSVKGVLARTLSVVSSDHVKPLFATSRMAYSTTLLIILWAFIGLAYPLYNGFVTVFLQTRGADFGDGSLYVTYRNQVILSTMGIPGALLAGWMVERRELGRKGTLAISTALTGVFLFASTTARTSGALLGWNCGYTFANNVMYGTLYAISPEIFPAKDRGTGNAMVAAANRVFGIMAPIVALYADLSTPVPIYVSGALFLVSGCIALLLPFEPRGKASL